jgi:hypothetical protein
MLRTRTAVEERGRISIDKRLTEDPTHNDQTLVTFSGSRGP